MSEIYRRKRPSLPGEIQKTSPPTVPFSIDRKTVVIKKTPIRPKK